MSAVRVCSTADVGDAAALRVEVPGPDGAAVPVAVVRDEEGDLHAVSDICTHQDVSLSEGEVEGCQIECWLHGSSFDLRSGAPTGLPATRPVAVYHLTVDGGDVLVDVESSPQTQSPQTHSPQTQSTGAGRGAHEES